MNHLVTVPFAQAPPLLIPFMAGKLSLIQGILEPYHHDDATNDGNPKNQNKANKLKKMILLKLIRVHNGDRSPVIPNHRVDEPVGEIL